MIPVAEKDLPTLSYVIESVRVNLNNPIDHIYIIGKKGSIERFCKSNLCEFLNEDAVLPIKKSDIVFEGREWYRSGWLFQQLIKLNADEIVLNENVLVLDADTCLAKHQSFVLEDDRFILNFSDEYHFPYRSYLKILKEKRRFYLSFVCHHMVFNKRILSKLKAEIQASFNKNWIVAILENIDYNQPSCFSEYEMYGNFLFYNYRHNVHLEYWNNKSIKATLLSEEVLEKNKGLYKSISFHRI